MHVTRRSWPPAHRCALSIWKRSTCSREN